MKKYLLALLIISLSFCSCTKINNNTSTNEIPKLKKHYDNFNEYLDDIKKVQNSINSIQIQGIENEVMDNNLNTQTIYNLFEKDKKFKIVSSIATIQNGKQIQNPIPAIELFNEKNLYLSMPTVNQNVVVELLSKEEVNNYSNVYNEYQNTKLYELKNWYNHRHNSKDNNSYKIINDKASYYGFDCRLIVLQDQEKEQTIRKTGEKYLLKTYKEVCVSDKYGIPVHSLFTMTSSTRGNLMSLSDAIKDIKVNSVSDKEFNLGENIKIIPNSIFKKNIQNFNNQLYSSAK